MNKREFGKRAEKLACYYIKNHGGVILSTNYFFPGGEIDIIYKDAEKIVFAEVKCRSNEKYGTAFGAVTIEKQRKISRGCDFFLYQNNLNEFTPIRFDVIGVTISEDDRAFKVDMIKDAFSYQQKHKRRLW